MRLMLPRDKLRHDRILVAARRLFTTLGFRGTTMEGVATAVGMSKRSLYQHFPSKLALLLEALDGMPESLLFPAAGFGGKLATSAPELLLNHSLGVLEQEGKRRAASVVPVPPAFYEDLRLHFLEPWHEVEKRRQDAARQLKDMLGRLQSAGLVREGLDLDVVVAVYQSSVFMVLDPAFLMAHRIAPDTAVSTLLDLFLAGVKRERAVDDSR